MHTINTDLLTNRLITIVADETGQPESALTPDTKLLSLGMDSLEFVCLLQRICDEFHDIPEGEWVKLNTIADIVEKLEA